MINISIHRPITILMLYLVIALLGVVSFLQLPIEFKPETNYPKLTITTYWRGASPEAMEAFVTSKIEESVNTVGNVRKVSSESMEGVSKVNIEFTRGTNMDFSALEVNEKLSLVREQLPYGTSPPQIEKYVPEEFETGEFLSFALVGPYSLNYLQELAEKKIRGTLSTIKGVSSVTVLGAGEREIIVAIDPFKLDAFGLTLSDVKDKIAFVNTTRSAGKIESQKTKDSNHLTTYPSNNLTHLITISNSITSIDELNSIFIANKNGQIIYLKNIATVKDTFREPYSLSRVNGNPRISIIIEKEPGTNTLKVADKVHNKISEIKKALPNNVTIIITEDQSQRIKKELAGLREQILFAVFILLIVLYIFLKNFSSTLIILSTIFFSLVLTINLIYFSGTSFNLLTLSGLALGFGMLVDNSIVVMENIYRHRSLIVNYSYINVMKATYTGTKEVIAAIIASTLTTVVVFIPFLYLKGELRDYYLPFGSAVGFSLLSSLFVSFTLIPALSVKYLKTTNQGLSNKSIYNLQSTIYNLIYSRILKEILKHPYATLLPILLIFAGTYHLFDKKVEKGEIFRWHDDKYLSVYFWMPEGSELSKTDNLVHTFEKKLLTIPQIQEIESTIYSEFAKIKIDFSDKVKNSSFPYILKEKLINFSNQFAGVNVRVYGFGLSFYGGGGGIFSQIKVLGYNYYQLGLIADDIGNRLKRSVRVKDVNTNFDWYGQRSELRLVIDRKRLNQYNLSVKDVAEFLSGYIGRRERSRIKIGENEVDIGIILATSRSMNVSELMNLSIPFSEGGKCRVKDICYVEEVRLPARILREEQQYQRIVAYEYRGPYKSGEALRQSVLEHLSLPDGFSAKAEDYLFLTKEQKKDIWIALILAVVLVYIVTSALFESLLHPLIIMVTVPLGLIGVFIIFLITHTNFDSSAYIGVILLCGIVVNNGIILVDHINNLRRNGMELHSALIQACQDRIRPILMTTATTVFGLLPFILLDPGKGEGQARIWYTLSLSTVGGLITSTIFTLTVIPTFYLLFEKLNIILKSEIYKCNW